MNSPAFMYGDHINEVINVSIEGRYHTSKDSFRGTWHIGDMKLENVLFSPGRGIVFYNGSERTFVGQIYFDVDRLQYSLEITDPVLYEKLTNRSSEGKTILTISSPSHTLKEAQLVNTELRNMKLPFEK